MEFKIGNEWNRCVRTMRADVIMVLIDGSMVAVYKWNYHGRNNLVRVALYDEVASIITNLSSYHWLYFRNTTTTDLSISRTRDRDRDRCIAPITYRVARLHVASKNCDCLLNRTCVHCLCLQWRCARHYWMGRCQVWAFI